MMIVITARFIRVVIGFAFFLFLYWTHIDNSIFMLKCTSCIKICYIIIIIIILLLLLLLLLLYYYYIIILLLLYISHLS